METRYISLEKCIKDLREYEKTAFSGLTVIGCISRIKRIPPSDVVPAPRWISVKERLPEPGERVLVTDGYFVGEAYIYNTNSLLSVPSERRWARSGMLLDWMNVTHWMPLQEPPKEGGQ